MVAAWLVLGGGLVAVGVLLAVWAALAPGHRGGRHRRAHHERPDNRRDP